MNQYLKENGIEVIPQYISQGLLRGTWRLYNPKIMWWGNFELQEKLAALGFKSMDGKTLTQYCASGDTFSAFVTFDRTDEFIN
jgi:hypothetical protein